MEEILEEEVVVNLLPEAQEELNKFLEDRLQSRQRRTSELWEHHLASSREKGKSPKNGLTNFDTITEPMQEYQASSHQYAKWLSRSPS